MEDIVPVKKKQYDSSVSAPSRGWVGLWGWRVDVPNMLLSLEL